MLDYCTLGGSGTYGVAALRRSEIELAMHHWLFGLKTLMTEQCAASGEQRCEGEGMRSRQPEQLLLPDCSWITRYRGTGVFRLRYGQISAAISSGDTCDPANEGHQKIRPTKLLSKRLLR
jgi:hypothetical protein